jgi:hypothetical protein
MISKSGKLHPFEDSLLFPSVYAIIALRIHVELHVEEIYAFDGEEHREGN